MNIVPEFMLYIVPILPVLIMSFITISYIVCTVHAAISLKRTNVYYNKFAEVTQIFNTEIFVAFCIAVTISIAGVLVGVPPRHAVLGMWYIILTFCSVLYIVFVVDYWNLKRKGII